MNKTNNQRKLKNKKRKKRCTAGPPHPQVRNLWIWLTVLLNLWLEGLPKPPGCNQNCLPVMSGRYSEACGGHGQPSHASECIPEASKMHFLFLVKQKCISETSGRCSEARRGLYMLQNMSQTLLRHTPGFMKNRKCVSEASGTCSEAHRGRAWSLHASEHFQMWPEVPSSHVQR